jgi:hypothetical protein
MRRSVRECLDTLDEAAWRAASETALSRSNLHDSSREQLEPAGRAKEGAAQTLLRGTIPCGMRSRQSLHLENVKMNGIIYIVGLVVIIGLVLSFFGLR